MKLPESITLTVQDREPSENVEVWRARIKGSPEVFYFEWDNRNPLSDILVEAAFAVKEEEVK